MRSASLLHKYATDETHPTIKVIENGNWNAAWDMCILVILVTEEEKEKKLIISVDHAGFLDGKHKTNHQWSLVSGLAKSSVHTE